MIRAVKVRLEATAAKQLRINALISEMRSAVNFYCASLWKTPGKLDAATLRRFLGGSLGYRQRQTALKIALETVVATRKAAKATGNRTSVPVVRGALRLSTLVANVEKGKRSFDYVVKISGFSKGNPITIPFKSHKRLNHWLSKPGAKILGGCQISESGCSVWVEVPKQEPRISGAVLGVDIGMNKLIARSDGEFAGTECRMVLNRVRRCRPGSQGRRKAARARTNFINRTLKTLPWESMRVLAMEQLQDMKRGKRPGRGKTFRKAVAPWVYREVLNRAAMLAQENRVRLELVDPRNTSRECPRCGKVAKENRAGEKFRCVSCNYSADADYIGARNILARTAGYCREPMVPGPLSVETSNVTV